MSDQDGRQAAAPPRPSPEDAAGWVTYWKTQGQPWRTQGEIAPERKDYLAHRRLIPPDIEQGRYPFKDVEPKLTRADIEWLLATHESEGICGPVDLSDERQRAREGLDLRGAHLEEEELSGLPLTRIRAGLTLDEILSMTDEQREMATVHLQQASLRGASLREADLMRANLQKANLVKTSLQDVDLREANLQEADLRTANLQEASLAGANLQEAFLMGANLQQTDFVGANLQRAVLVGANLQEADLKAANLQKANLTRAQLKGADLEGVILSNEKQFGPMLADCQWGDVNLAVIQWSQVKILGDEYVARQKKYRLGEIKSKQRRLFEYEAAVRANRQLAVILRNQGLNEVADRFAYRAHVLQWQVLQLAEQGQPHLLQQEETGQQNSDEGATFNLIELFTELLDWPRTILSEVADPLQKTSLLKVFLLAFQLLGFLSLLIAPLCLCLLLLLCLPFVCIWPFEIIMALVVRFFPGSSTRQGHTQLRLQPLPLPLGMKQFKASILSAIQQVYSLFGLFFHALRVNLVSLATLLLDLLTGYGYKPGRIFFWYVVVVLGFALAYYAQAPHVLLVQNQHGPLSWTGAIILSITAFHGRGFFLGGEFGYESTVTLLAAIEAIIGLFIELCFIATFTQRFLGR